MSDQDFVIQRDGSPSSENSSSIITASDSSSRLTTPPPSPPRKSTSVENNILFRFIGQNMKDSLPPPKLIDLILQKIEQEEIFFSFEYFPPRTPQGAANLVSRLESN